MVVAYLFSRCFLSLPSRFIVWKGWRRNMEDEHIAVDLALPGGESGGIAMFGVWDGHGGKEVARYVRRHMSQEIVKLSEYREGNYETALVKAFHRMDEMLWDEANLKELNALKKDAAKKTEEGTSTTGEATSDAGSTGGGTLVASSSSSSSRRRRHTIGEAEEGSGAMVARKADGGGEDDGEDDDGDGDGDDDDDAGTAQVLQLFKTLLAARNEGKAAAAAGGAAAAAAAAAAPPSRGGAVAAASSSLSPTQPPNVCSLPSVHVRSCWQSCCCG
jgi:protein phosphatase 1G